MKKRLRKKKHLGEFTEWGRKLVITRNRKDGFDEFLNAFIDDAVEANGCDCGGIGMEDKLDVVVELGRRYDDPDARLNRITAWLDDRPDVEKWRLGEEFNIWHGVYQDINDEIEQTNGANGRKQNGS